ncbi:MAG TPA: cytochrome c biogenesis protein CcdA [bacterium]|jgi:cytochrome c biogenesis protein CcdA
MTSVTLPAVLIGGLLDGVNPCAFSVLLSFVAVVLSAVAISNTSPQVWRIGGVYVLGIFVTYLLLGLGVIGVIAPFVQMHLAVRIIGITVVALGAWTLKDAVAPGFGPALAMPKAAYGLVRKALSWSGPGGALAAGALVAMCEVPCSGAIYVGVLALLSKSPVLERVGYLLIYNVMFIAPLVALLALVGNRRSYNRIAHWSIHRRSGSRYLLGGFTLALGFAILLTA